MCQIWAHPEMTTVPEMNAKTPRASIVNGGVRAARNRCAVLGTKDLGDLNSTAQPPPGKSTPGAASGTSEPSWRPDGRIRSSRPPAPGSLGQALAASVTPLRDPRLAEMR
ncbi:hypothetical protein CEP54_011298 [Fusarium duplospermum]|uniref:Uncharacterized protein n=1 Tax=Fusarium duplospermum TaxID=1325734 RepID=A0A428PFB9_9HYPO|nr:hypothetical protein CEP54_011298 [Fusarium duplospermum]